MEHLITEADNRLRRAQARGYKQDQTRVNGCTQEGANRYKQVRDKPLSFWNRVEAPKFMKHMETPNSP